ncbi:MAG: class I tRNA ligase family protein, partial [Syntrophorhabdaceae bacterium]|nr:class I tRNA ligase family protein [Syntrophorhabdaceae bacterium]
MEKVYDPHKIEKKWYTFWVEQGFFSAYNNPSGPPFSMVIPPPNVTGSLHMGHALNNTLQ